MTSRRGRELPNTGGSRHAFPAGSHIAGGSMRLGILDGPASAPDAATICRLFAEGTRWRVRVESWEASDGGVSGRFVFEPDGPASWYATRESGPALRAGRREEVFAAAHEMPEARLRELLHSLS
jgi:hypothetical protein